MNKRILNMLLAVIMLVGILPASAITASADSEYSGIGAFTQCSSKLTSGYYIFGVGEDTEIDAINNTVGASWIKFTKTSLTNGTIENPDPSIVWYYDATAGTFKNGDNYVYWPTSGNTGGVGTESTSLTVTETDNSGVYNITVTSTPACMLRLNGTSGYRFYTSTTGNATFYFFKLVIKGTQENPFVVSTAEELQAAIDSTENDINYIKLGNDISGITTAIKQEASDKPFILDLNSKTITGTSDIQLYGSATIKNGTINADWGIYAQNASFVLEDLTVHSTQTCGVHVDGGAGTITNCTITSTATEQRQCAILCGGTVTANRVVLKGAEYAFIVSDGTFILDGVELTGYTSTPSYASDVQIVTHTVTGTDTNYNYSFEMVSPQAENGIFIVALFGEGNRLVGTETIPMQEANTTYTKSSIPIKTTAQANTYKIMFWSGLDTLIPICEAKGGNITVQ